MPAPNPKPPPSHYDSAQLEAALRSVGVQEGDIVFTHVGLGLLGYPNEGATEEAMYRVARDAFMRVLGPRGTLLAPAYSYSFCRGEDFDPDATPSTAGPFAERFRKESGGLRSLDPIFSVGGLGPAAAELLRDLPRECFGPDSFFDRLLRAGGKLCNIGVGFRFATYVHFVEHREAVPYRFRKRFPGWVCVRGRRDYQEWLSFVRVQVDNTLPDLRRLQTAAAACGGFARARVGRGEVTCVRCVDMDRFCAEGIRRDPWFLARGPALDLAAGDCARCGPQAPATAIPVTTSDSRPEPLLRSLAPLPAYPLSSACETAVARLAADLPVRTLSCFTGARAGRTVVPERWLCRDASLEEAGGRTILSLRDHPLLASYYSAPCDTELELAEIRPRLRTHALSEAVPLGAEPDHLHWSLCVSAEFREALKPGRYRARIDAFHLYGSMTVAEVLAEGVTEEIVVIAAHADHRGMANDSLSGAVAASCAMRRRIKERGRQSVLLLLAPKTFGLPWYFRSRPEVATRARALILVESMGLAEEPVLQFPRQSEGPCHRAVVTALKEAAPALTEARGDSAWLSAADLADLPHGLPVYCLNRSAHPLDKEAPYPGFRTSLETPDFVSFRHLEDSVDLLSRFLSRLDSSVERRRS
ncbi:MAG: DUF4910 domain-containing protein [Elusimicrobia bacterium]|nr:DUF4910 domain-containing protein [Elusimicrobiota bacterium]